MISTAAIRPEHPDPFGEIMGNGCPSCNGTIRLGEFDCMGVCQTCYWEAVKESQQKISNSTCTQEDS